MTESPAQLQQTKYLFPEGKMWDKKNDHIHDASVKNNQLESIMEGKRLSTITVTKKDKIPRNKS